jgi:hypothetical protein
MSEQKERGDVEQALNELEEATRLGLTEGIKLANKRLDALGVSSKRRAAVGRRLAAEEAEEASTKDESKPDPKVAPPVERKAPGASSKA